MGKRRLPEEVKRFGISLLARWETPTRVSEQIKEKFGIDITPQALEHYDPGKWAGRDLSEEYRRLFEAERTQYLKALGAPFVSHRIARLWRLQHACERAETDGNLSLVLQILEQARKECANLPDLDRAEMPRNLADFYADMARGKPTGLDQFYGGKAVTN